jgi:hypothetical protein
MTYILKTSMYKYIELICTEVDTNWLILEPDGGHGATTARVEAERY